MLHKRSCTVDICNRSNQQKSVTNTENISKDPLSSLISLKLGIYVSPLFCKINMSYIYCRTYLITHISIFIYFNYIIKCTVKITTKLYKHLHRHIFVMPHFWDCARRYSAFWLSSAQVLILLRSFHNFCNLYYQTQLWLPL